jgi:hypothetical protein
MVLIICTEQVILGVATAVAFFNGHFRSVSASDRSLTYVPCPVKKLLVIVLFEEVNALSIISRSS